MTSEDVRLDDPSLQFATVTAYNENVPTGNLTPETGCVWEVRGVYNEGRSLLVSFPKTVH